MRLLLEIGADKRWSNLLIVNEVIIIIPNEYIQKEFWNIDLACQNSKITEIPIILSVPIWLLICFFIMFYFFFMII